MKHLYVCNNCLSFSTETVCTRCFGFTALIILNDSFDPKTGHIAVLSEAGNVIHFERKVRGIRHSGKWTVGLMGTHFFEYVGWVRLYEQAYRVTGWSAFYKAPPHEWDLENRVPEMDDIRTNIYMRNEHYA